MFLVLAFLMGNSESLRSGTYHPPAKMDIEQLQHVRKEHARSVNDFGKDLLLTTDKPGSNTFISPLSVYDALSIVAFGAANRTLDQFKHIFHLDTSNSAEDLVTVAGLLTTAKQRENTPPLFTEANSIWLSNTLSVNPDFLANADRAFDATAKKLNFGSPQAAQTINKWVDTQTHGMIKNIIDSLSADIRAVIVNTIYFKMDWQSKFDAMKTNDGFFKLFNSGRVKVKMMNQEGQMEYIRNDKMSAVVLPFENPFANMLIVLPKDDTEEALRHCAESILSNDAFSAFVQSKKRLLVNLSLPRFSLECSYELNDILKSMGLQDAFTEDAQFPGISTERLAIDAVIHKTKLEVTENGVAAAAATAIMMRVMGFVDEPKIPTYFTVDRPFITALFDSRTNQVFFSGIIRSVSSGETNGHTEL
ncbi:putative Serine protease inhibitor 42Dd [Blattamonas nauphoetae]|uniref:Serine protease inhibitor 42Dd n=1 Tax=Blattamonas nauphoetae TaxID=2049346 RepID=A0ABQ9X8Z9_9EUKA|nr:putative Serine protease inhibitor 42Dd [Blattamonas nauphoetae]